MKYFKDSEFECQCGQCGLGIADMNRGLLEKLDTARNLAATPFVINSAVRCYPHNEKVGGSDNSSHMRGFAVDIKSTVSGSRFRILKSLFDAGFRRIGVYGTFIHVDVDPSLPPEVCWHQ